MKYLKIILTLALIISTFYSCKEDETTIQLHDDVRLKSSYSTEINTETNIKPSITGFANATYTWTNLSNNVVISTERNLSYKFTTIGNYQLRLTVKADKTGELKTANTTVIVK